MTSVRNTAATQAAAPPKSVPADGSAEQKIDLRPLTWRARYNLSTCTVACPATSNACRRHALRLIDLCITQL